MNRNNGEKHEGTILLHLRRTYGKDEAFAFVDKMLRDAKVEIGMLKAELAEVRSLKIKKANMTEALYREELIKKLNDKLSVQGTELSKLRKELDHWRARALQSNISSFYND